MSNTNLKLEIDPARPGIAHIVGEDSMASLLLGMRCARIVSCVNAMAGIEDPAALIEALRTINRLHDLGDAIYDVKSSAVENGEPFEGDSWDHPNVKAYSDAVQVVKAAIAPKEPTA